MNRVELKRRIKAYQLSQKDPISFTRALTEVAYGTCSVRTLWNCLSDGRLLKDAVAESIKRKTPDPSKKP